MIDPINPLTGTSYRGRYRGLLLEEQRSPGNTRSDWFTFVNARQIGRPVKQGQTVTWVRDRLASVATICLTGAAIDVSLLPGHRGQAANP